MKKIMFSIIMIFLIICFSVATIVAIDLCYHIKFDKIAGLNYKGYRGKVIGMKKANEIRIVVLGGSFVFGYGIGYTKALPATLEKELQVANDKYGRNKKITVVNLAFNSEGAYAFYYDLKDFLYLGYDYAILCEGYNDLGIGNTTAYRHSNPIFRIFGYMPILPLIMQEKKMVIENNGNLEDAYRGKKIVFKPNAKDRMKISLLQTALNSYNKIESIADRLNKIDKVDFDIKQIGQDPWAWYKYFTKKAIQFALDNKKKVIVVTQPYLGEVHIEQQKALKEMLEKEYKDNDSVLYVNLGDAISADDKTITFDGMHLTDRGSEVVAGKLSREIIDFIK